MDLVIRTRSGNTFVYTGAHPDLGDSLRTGMRNGRDLGDVTILEWRNPAGRAIQRTQLRLTEIESITEHYDDAPETDQP